MDRKLLFGVLAIVMMVLAACTPIEYGEVIIVSPSDSIIRQDYNGPINFEVVLKSTFDTPKEARVLQDNGQVSTCVLSPNMPQSCGFIQLTNTNQAYTVRAEVRKKNGEIVSDSVILSWEPYSSFDKLASRFVFGSWPAVGYFVFFLVLELVTYTFGFLITRHSTKAVLSSALVGVVLAVSLWFLPSMGGAQVSLFCVVPVVVLLWAIFQNRLVRPKPLLVLRKQGGGEIAYLPTPMSKEGKTKVVDMQDINRDLRFPN